MALARISPIAPAQRLTVDQNRPSSQRAEGEEMKRQITKGLAMFMFTLALAAASSAVVNGQSNARLVAHVPFEFMVGDQTFAAGEYRVGAIDQSGETIAISNGQGEGAIRSTSPKQRLGGDKSAKLMFHRYGSSYFLTQVWRAGEATGREL